MQEWLKKYQKADDELFSIPSRLCEIARAFSVVGNDTISEELYKISYKIKRCRVEMNQAVSQSTNESLGNSQKISGIVLESVFKETKK